MFTGIIRHVGAVHRISSRGGGKRLTIDLGPLAAESRDGDSISVSGVCLTVAQLTGSQADFDVVSETLSRSTLGALKKVGKVNLERALRLSDGLDGHIVQGHVDGIAQVRSIRSGLKHVVELAGDERLSEQMVPKGSICIDGVSLTLVDVSEGLFSVAIVPTTLAETTLGDLKPGSKVNIETDIIGKYVRKHLRALQAEGDGGVTLEKLGEAGFL